ncbi:MAG: Splicing factor [Vezdaea aestivalis]|nr:MAG: Splicing factor [Vezdaea aestivalis]
MDIKSLLSTPDVENGRPSSRTAENYHQEGGTSSFSHAQNPQVSAPLPPVIPNINAHVNFMRPSPSAASPPGASTSASSTPSADIRLKSTRTPSTAGMDTLADLASMQHHQQAARTSASGLRNPEIYESRSLPLSPSFPTANSIPSVRAGHPSADGDGGAMKLASKLYEAETVVKEELEVMNQLANHISENPYNYPSHAQLVHLLHSGFETHCRDVPEKPESYELLKELREARENFFNLYAVGQDAWLAWIEDEITLARSIDEMVGVMELFNKCLGETSASPEIWARYGKWMYSTFLACHPERGSSPQFNWTLDDMEAGAELFSWATMISVWDQANKATKWHIDNSNVVWDAYIDTLIQDLRFARTQQKIGFIKTLFVGRIQVPHMTEAQTSQNFSTFVSEFDNDAYENTMVSANKKARPAKDEMSKRAGFEENISQAIANGSQENEWAALSTYLEWETSQSLKKVHMDLCNALFERATLRFSSNSDLWEEYSIFLQDKMQIGLTKKMEVVPDILSLVRRASRHCPWSGAIWSLYLTIAETSAQQFHEIEDIKHKATSSGLLEVGGMEEVLKVHNTWCGFLKRRTFHEKATDEEMDVAEVGIRSALESVKQLGERKFGKEYKGDPTYRLERIYVQYLGLSGDLDHAREFWKSLIPSAGNNYEFWIRWYHWEMICWAKQSGLTRIVSRPVQATSVLRQASKRAKLDWPEKIFEKFLSHVEDYDSADEMLTATASVRRSMKAVAARRLKEAEAAASSTATLPVVQGSVEESVSTSVEAAQPTGKRKREKDEPDQNPTLKKSKAEEEATLVTLDGHPDGNIKRDREHASVSVRNLPPDATEIQIRQFFKDCGTINTLKLTKDEGDTTATCVVEFETKEETEVALTRDKKTLGGQEVEVTLDSGSTLYVANFSATADEQYLHKLFEKYGEIIDIRLPSLKFNRKRRFCYVQFKDSDQAKSACQLDNLDIEGQHLLVKISNPNQKQDKSGAIYEGRQICVRNLSWKVTETELEETFLQFGSVENVRLPRKIDGGHKGFAFVDFSSPEASEAALAMDKQKLQGRSLSVQIAVLDFAKNKDTSTSKGAASPTNDSAPVSRSSSVAPKQSQKKPSYQEIQERTVVILNVPDTLSEARIQAIAQTFGTIVKVTLSPSHQGATVEFKDVREAGKAAMGLEGHEIAPQRFLRIGTMQELKSEKPERRTDKMQTKPSTALKPATVKRPAQTKKKRLAVPTMTENQEKPNEDESKAKEVNGNAKGRSNADFRSLYLNK